MLTEGCRRERAQPPGTGKSQTIVSLISLLKLHFRIPQPILLAAPTHVSTDHLLSLLVRRGLNPLRCGKPSKVSPEIEKWTIEKRQEQHPLWNRLEATRLESESVRDELKKSKEATASILHPQERAIAEARDGALRSNQFIASAEALTHASNVPFSPQSSWNSDIANCGGDTSCSSRSSTRAYSRRLMSFARPRSVRELARSSMYVQPYIQKREECADVVPTNGTVDRLSDRLC